MRISLSWSVGGLGVCVLVAACAISEPPPRPVNGGVVLPFSGGAGNGPAGGVAGMELVAGTGASGTGVAGMAGPPPAGSGGGFPAGTGAPGGTGGGVPAVREFDAGSDPNRNAVTAGRICQRLAEIQCAGEAYCCDNPGNDVASCKQKQQSACTSMAMADDIAADPVAGFDAAQAMIVFTELERLASTCDPTITAYGDSPTGVRSMFRGTKGANEDCRPVNPLSQVMAGAALASCTNPQSQACLPSGLNWRCTAHQAEGGDCFSDFNCQPGLYCDNPSLSIEGGQCLRRKPVGQGCSLGNECESLYCVGGSCVAADQQTVYCLE